MNILTIEDIIKQAKENAESAVKEIKNNVVLSDYELESNTSSVATSKKDIGNTKQ